MILEVLLKPCHTRHPLTAPIGTPQGHPQIKHECSHLVDHPQSLQRNL